MTDLNSLIAEARERYNAAQEAQKAQKAQALEDKKASALESFKDKLWSEIPPPILKAIGCYYDVAVDSRGDTNCFARFRLTDEHEKHWAAQFTYINGNRDLKFEFPNLARHPAHRDREWHSVSPGNGISWSDFILVLIGEWNDEVERLKAKLLEDAQQEELWKVQAEQARLERERIEQAFERDKAVTWNKARQQDQEIQPLLERAIAQVNYCQYFESIFPLILYRWRWNTGVYYAGEEGSQFDYDHAYSFECEPDGEGWITPVSGNRFKLIPDVNKPVVEEVICFTPKDFLRYFSFSSQIVNVKGIKRQYDEHGKQIFLWDSNATTDYWIGEAIPPQWLRQRLNLPEPVKEIAIAPDEERELIPTSTDLGFYDDNFHGY